MCAEYCVCDLYKLLYQQEHDFQGLFVQLEESLHTCIQVWGSV